MDLIRSNAEKIGGSVELESKTGEGTTLRLNVPQTMAIVPALVVRSGGRCFALPKNALVELVHVSVLEREQKIECAGSSEIDRLRDHSLLRVRLDRLLELESREETHGYYIAVIETESCRFGLVVDGLLSSEEIVMKPLSTVPREIGVFLGTAVLGDGTLALVLDAAGLAARVAIHPEWKQGALGSGKTAEGFLVIDEDRDRTRATFPRVLAERMESVPFDRIKYANGRSLLHYRAELLHLKEEGRPLREVSLPPEQLAKIPESWRVVA